MLTNTPEPPYYAVIFTSVKNKNFSGYAEMADKMVRLAKNSLAF